VSYVCFNRISVYRAETQGARVPRRRAPTAAVLRSEMDRPDFRGILGTSACCGRSEGGVCYRAASNMRSFLISDGSKVFASGSRATISARRLHRVPGLEGAILPGAQTHRIATDNSR